MSREIDRREFLKSVGTAAAAASLGGAGLILQGCAAGKDYDLVIRAVWFMTAWAGTPSRPTSASPASGSRPSARSPAGAAGSSSRRRAESSLPDSSTFTTIPTWVFSPIPGRKAPSAKA